tara:strand:- start:197 stop:589 length:393 start_codon:yes stop_codon:yes gene_type:complete
MRNYRNNNRRRYRTNSFDRNLKLNSTDQNLNSNFGNVSDFKKKNFPRNSFNSSKLIQKYSDLAREALSSGDKILYENYMQHAEHFIRISENNNSSQINKNESSNGLDKMNISKISDDKTNSEDKLKTDKS